MCTGMLFWGLQKPHSDFNLFGDVRLHIWPIRGLSADDISPLIIPAKARDYVFTGVGLSVSVCVCLSVTTVTKRMWTDLYQILWEGS